MSSRRSWPRESSPGRGRPDHTRGAISRRRDRLAPEYSGVADTPRRTISLDLLPKPLDLRDLRPTVQEPLTAPQHFRRRVNGRILEQLRIDLGLGRRIGGCISDEIGVA